MKSRADSTTVGDCPPSQVTQSQKEDRAFLTWPFLELTKPRLIPLLLISMVCPMIYASGGQISYTLLVACLLGASLVTASANICNCIWDRDIDMIMSRTKHRPIPTGRASVQAACLYSAFLCVTGALILFYFANPLTALLSLFGHFFYVVIYTILLKRSTPQNIVIGGAAGAIPPLVGIAAVTNDITVEALLMFLVVFLWTPPHFWALALNKNSDYTKAKIPMMPVVHGETHTIRQMVLYSILLIPATLALVFYSNTLGLFSLIVMGATGLLFTYKILILQATQNSNAREPNAWKVFGFSLVYLPVFFCCLVIDSIVF